ncbi:MAG: 23S rRNA (uracil(1939)-C(5))-methyltransferase RlmD [Planctomycetota bacterium]|jgi:23S rRNA (uracil1939-C5)-methyltransferase
MKHTPTTSAERAELDIDALSYGRAGVGRTDEGKVVFVEGAAPGDRVRVMIERDRGTYAEARIDEILVAGATRVDPPCPLVDRCGGCPWQHVDYDQQLAAKRQSVVDALERIAGIDSPNVDPVVPSPDTLAYRNRLKLRFDSGRLGFYSARTHSLVPIDDCIVAEPIVSEALETVRDLAASLSTHVLRVEIASRGQLSGVVVALNSEGRLRRADVHRVREFLALPGNPVRGVVMWGRGWRRSWGDTRRRHTTAGGLTAETTGTAFGQVNTGANRLLVDKLLAAVKPRKSDTLLDLYAGAGNFTLPLAAHVRQVIAVESDRDSIEAGRRSCEYHGITNAVFFESRVESFLAAEAGGRTARALRRSPDIIVANPPRNGLGEAAASIARLRAPRFVYVSCNPTTLARDLRIFVDAGYRLSSVAPVDLFPHTFHVETVCHALLT